MNSQEGLVNNQRFSSEGKDLKLQLTDQIRYTEDRDIVSVT